MGVGIEGVQTPRLENLSTLLTLNPFLYISQILYIERLLEGGRCSRCSTCSRCSRCSTGFLKHLPLNTFPF